MDYPPEKYYIGTGIITDKDRGKAKQTAKLQAISDLASQIQTTVTATKTSSTLDNGTKQDLTFGELIEETLYQEFENIIYIEEAYTAKKEQTTYAIMSRDAWEGQKARKILAERTSAEAIVSARYPDMSPVREITILSDAIASLEATMWGALVEAKFDDTYGFLLPMVKARREILYSRVLYSNLYHISEGSSPVNIIGAKDDALLKFQIFLTEKLCKEYESLRVRVSSSMSATALRDTIAQYVPYSLAQNPNLLEYFEGPDSIKGLYHVYLLVSKTAWEEQEQRAIDELYQQVKSMELAFQADVSVTGKLNILERLEQLLSTSIFGLAVENIIFPHQASSNQSIPSLREHLIDSVRLSLKTTNSVEEGEKVSIKVIVTNTSNLKTDIPVLCTVYDDKGKQRYSGTVPLSQGKSLDIEIGTDTRESAKNFNVRCFWTRYPQQKAEATIGIDKIPILTKIKRWFGI